MQRKTQALELAPMNENSECISLRIFSGIHLGAEISLCSGSYVLGKDMSCDIILRDQSITARHIRILVTQNPETSTPTQESTNIDNSKISVHIQNLDGNISHKDEVLADNSELVAQELYSLGQVRFVWFRYGETADLAEIVQKDLQDEAEATTAPIINADSEHGIDNTNDNNVDGEGGNFVGDDTQDTPNTTDDKYLRWRHYALLSIIILLLFGITISISDNANKISHNKALLASVLEEGKFSSLTIQEDKGNLVVQGVLKNDSEFKLLSKLVQSMHFPVYFDVKIEKDLMRALLQAMNGQSFYPILKLNAYKKELTIGMYVKDKLVLQGLKLQLNELFPVISSYKISYDVYFERKIKALINQEFSHELKNKIRMEFLPGIIKIFSNLPPAGILKVKEELNKISEKLQITLVADFMFEEPKNRLVQKDAKPFITVNESTTPQVAVYGSEMPSKSTETATVQNPKNNDVAVATSSNAEGVSSSLQAMQQESFEFRVTSINIKPVKYIVLSTAQRIFMGGILPGGYTLMDVDLDVLSLEKDGRITTYILNQNNN